MTKDEYNSKFWMYYLNLEEEFCDTLNFVELIEDNFSTYSKQFARQLVSIGSEIDITFKALCREINPDINAKCITDYAKILCGWNDFPNAKVQLKTGMKRFVPGSRGITVRAR